VDAQARQSVARTEEWEHKKGGVIVIKRTHQSGRRPLPSAPLPLAERSGFGVRGNGPAGGLSAATSCKDSEELPLAPRAAKKLAAILQ
jgi:hypothetical protein